MGCRVLTKQEISRMGLLKKIQSQGVEYVGENGTLFFEYATPEVFCNAMDVMIHATDERRDAEQAVFVLVTFGGQTIIRNVAGHHAEVNIGRVIDEIVERQNRTAEEARRAAGSEEFLRVSEEFVRIVWNAFHTHPPTFLEILGTLNSFAQAKVSKQRCVERLEEAVRRNNLAIDEFYGVSFINDLRNNLLSPEFVCNSLEKNSSELINTYTDLQRKALNLDLAFSVQDINVAINLSQVVRVPVRYLAVGGFDLPYIRDAGYVIRFIDIDVLRDKLRNNVIAEYDLVSIANKLSSFNQYETIVDFINDIYEDVVSLNNQLSIKEVRLTRR